MTFFPVALLVSSAWAQPNPNGEPSPTVQQEQTQADYARKGHPHSGKPQKQEPASLRTKDSKGTGPKPKKGQAAVRVDK